MFLQSHGDEEAARHSGAHACRSGKTGPPCLCRREGWCRYLQPTQCEEAFARCQVALRQDCVQGCRVGSLQRTALEPLFLRTFLHSFIAFDWLAAWTCIGTCCSIARMKKAKSGKRPSATRRASALKTPGRKSNAPKSAPKTAAPQSVDKYFDRLSEPARSALHKMRQGIRSVVPPDATEIISYNIPGVEHKKMLVWYAAFTNHCSLFPTKA